MNLSALDDVLMTSRGTYEQLRGLHPELGALALIDFCLRAIDAGQRIVSVPDARVRATTSEYILNDLPGLWQLRRNWCKSHTRDPYYSRHYRNDRGDFALSQAALHPADPAQDADTPTPAISLGARSASTLSPTLVAEIIAEDSAEEIEVR